MRGVDEGFVGQREEFVVQRVVEVAAEFVGAEAERGAEVGAADVADEHGVAGEDSVRISCALGEIEDEDRDRLDGVAGGFVDLEAHAGEFECVAVVHGDEGVFGDGASAEMDGGVRVVAELEVAGDEVGVEVRQEDVTDLEAECVGVVEILLDVALGVDDDRGVAGFVAEQVGGVGETAQVVLFEDHAWSQRTTDTGAPDNSMRPARERQVQSLSDRRVRPRRRPVSFFDGVVLWGSIGQRDACCTLCAIRIR